MKNRLTALAGVSALALLAAMPARATRSITLASACLPEMVVPRSASDPCIICATTQAHNPVGFGYNNFDSTGNDSTFNLFSSNITGSFASGDDVTVTPYTGSELRGFLSGLGDVFLRSASRSTSTPRTTARPCRPSS